MTRLTTILFAVLCLTTAAHAQDTLKVLSTGRLLRYNGADRVPIGLFGIHSTTMDEAKRDRWGIEQVRTIQAGPTGQPTLPGSGVAPSGISMIIDCWYDRYRPALMLENRTGWASGLTNLATTYANATLTTGKKHYLEFWNEPFLNWESKPGVNYDPRFYDSSNAVVGGPVFRQGMTTPEPHLVWKRGWWATQIVPTINDYVSVYVNVASRWSQFEQLPIGGTIAVGSRTYKKFECWLADDTSTSSYYSGYQNAIYYNRMYSVVANAVKAVNPDVHVLAGWGQQFHQDNYNSFRLQIRPTIDSNISLIDGLHEHHYGGDTRNIATGYETAWSYAKGRYGKSLQVFNTEAGGFLDPQVPNVVNPGRPSNPLVASRGGYTYTYRDITYLVAHSPDKAASRCAHEAHLNGGDTLAFMQLKSLRGRLVAATSSSTSVWAAASTNGNQYTVALFHDNNNDRVVRVRIVAPHGQYLGLGTVYWAIDSSNGIQLAPQRRVVSAFDSVFEETITMSAKMAYTYVFDLTGQIDSTNHPTIDAYQYASPTVVTEANNGAVRTYNFNVDPGQLAAARSARVKLGLGTNNGATLQVGNFSAPVTGTMIQYVDVPVAEITPATTITLTGGTGVTQVRFVSLELLTEPLRQPVAVRPASLASAPTVGPNPFSQYLRLQAPDNALLSQVTVYSLDGKVWHEAMPQQAGYLVPGTTLPRGVYVVHTVDSQGHHSTQKVVKE